MDTDKIQPILLDEMKRLRASGPPGARLPVIVSVVSSPDGRLRDAAALEAAVRTSQAPLRARLAEMGVREFTPLTLANALEVALTPDQIQAVAAEPTVKAIVWNRLERVTTAGT